MRLLWPRTALMGRPSACGPATRQPAPHSPHSSLLTGALATAAPLANRGHLQDIRHPRQAVHGRDRQASAGRGGAVRKAEQAARGRQACAGRREVRHSRAALHRHERSAVRSTAGWSPPTLAHAPHLVARGRRRALARGLSVVRAQAGASSAVRTGTTSTAACSARSCSSSACPASTPTR